MGYHIAYAAFKTNDVTAVLSSLKLKDTGEVDEYNETPMSGAMLPNGWYVVWSNDLQWGWLQEGLFIKLSASYEILVSIVEETTMTFMASGFSSGKKNWTIFHDGQQRVDHIEIEGDLPAAFNEIYKRNAALQKAEDQNEQYSTDYYASIPPEVVASICAFQYDLARDDNVKFTALEPA